MKRTLKTLALSFIFAGIALVLLARAPLMENPLPPFSEKVTRSVETIFMIGRALGNHPDVFTRVGDSITVSHHFLYPIGDQNYQLGDHLYLQPVIDAFTHDSNAFAHRPITAGVGWAAWAPLSRTFTPPDRCAPAESPLVCEYRLLRPSIAFIMFGTNDVGYRTLDEYRADLQSIIDTSIQMGVIPVLSTIPDRPEMPEKIARYNAVVRDLTTAQNLPLWDYAAALAELPNSGLTYDNLHPSAPPGEDDRSAYFLPETLRYGYTVRNLTALQMLDRIWQIIQNIPERNL